MCGIIGYTGGRQAASIILEGLTSLEYRGYDSAGIAVMDKAGKPQLFKAAGKLSNLKQVLSNGLPDGSTGIGHTRWATHGGPTEDNAHPHSDCSKDVIVVHNGIVENYQELKQELTEKGHVFSSQTDAECVPHLIESYLQDDYSLEDAVLATANRIRGANAIVVISKREPDKIISFKLGNAGGIVVGYGKDEMLLASDLPALLPHTRDVVYLAGGEMVVVTKNHVSYTDLEGNELKKSTLHMPYDALTAAKGEYKHFMLKEIHEQPEAIIDALRGRVSFDDYTVDLEHFPFSDEELKQIRRVVIVGMGTSQHAAMVGRLWMESLAGIATEADNSSEFRYRDPVIDKDTLVVSISQSGETADTLSAMDEAKSKGARQITLCNYEGTQTTRVADGTILIRAGLEVGVASSKTFVCSLVALYLLAMYIGSRRGHLSKERREEMIKELAHLPQMMGTLLTKENEAVYESLAREYSSRRDFLFLGRGINYPLAMEGALKLKEISYIHAEGYPAGEMKHGPISLIDEEMPVVALIPKDDLYEKMLSNINEVKARGGTVIAVATEGDEGVLDKADHAIYIPKSSSNVTPILMSIPMQLLSYHIAVRRGCDVDQPRNLAKSVTVE
ncbi:MAG: glutamine--fructose-6-phosphate transaminase (isomerizing) [SAR202 cluster bacterium Casp-Chloro-G4]|nr:glutamine--fructose-6-phosphate transaminase (isomerizing) [Chloroflexota bacterium]PKB61444.1 MAG: glutamine--fructose-6-phosphate transaminase (isomerizing) [SAR202 cluster bacterium Casp-Chloro-G4]